MALKLLLDNTSVKTLSQFARWINLSQILPITEQVNFNCVGRFWGMESALCNESVPDKNARFVVSGKQNAIYKEAAANKSMKRSTET